MLVKKVLSILCRDRDKGPVKTGVCDTLIEQSITMACEGNDDKELSFCRPL